MSAPMTEYEIMLIRLTCLKEAREAKVEYPLTNAAQLWRNIRDNAFWDSGRGE